jgi:drug/metabolite transporter (DMT)-like permease
MLLLRRVFSRMQWAALCISVAGVCLVQLGSGSAAGEAKSKGEGGNHAGGDEQFIGLVTVFVMCWTSAFAGLKTAAGNSKSMGENRNII